MVDAALIKACADASLKPTIVEKFIAAAGSNDPLAVTVRSGKRVILVPKPTTPDETLDLIRQSIGRNVVRVGITQYPAGLGVLEAGELKPDLVDACANLRMGTALFAKTYRVVLKWYGNPLDGDEKPEVFEDAVLAWQSGYFEGKSVFRTPDPDEVDLPQPIKKEPLADTSEQPVKSGGEEVNDLSGEPARDGNPSTAGIRIDLSGIGAK
ncbi:conjugal transfer protein TraH [Mesorhizobium sp. SARCC-RB16n]|uniref:TraH family protein n=1 Tax=Mesorhizobium sp. SARCC-RB16n TaxID=2116687 RepID=UPI00122EC72D|nr:TraH family protein [Mesorhizobium sp. SARCC-RB16n]KAA3448209.1 conjugal transfer protein TraH [Mesorhizobium sp. SARCC-RB16n]